MTVWAGVPLALAAALVVGWVIGLVVPKPWGFVVVAVLASSLLIWAPWWLVVVCLMGALIGAIGGTLAHSSFRRTSSRLEPK